MSRNLLQYLIILNTCKSDKMTSNVVTYVSDNSEKLLEYIFKSGL